MARLDGWPAGRARQLCPGSSDVDFLCDLDGVIDLYAEVADCALDLCVSEQKLYGAEVPGATVDQRGLGSAQRMRAELQGVTRRAARSDGGGHDRERSQAG